MNKLTIIPIILIMMVTFSYKNSSAQNSPEPNCYTYTPNGTIVYMFCHSSEPLSPAVIASTNADADNYSPYAFRVGDASGKYNCHSYAWLSNSPNNPAWMNNPNDDKYWNDGSYTQVSENQSSKISYASDDHSGNTFEGQYIGWVHSKWGMAPRMIHWKTISPYNASNLRYYVKSSNNQRIATKETKASSFIISPVPASDFLNIRFESQNPVSLSIQIFDINQRIIRNQKYHNIPTGESRMTLDIQNIMAGIYMVSGTTSNGEIYLRKLIITK